jgi:hypothetical protein
VNPSSNQKRLKRKRRRHNPIIPVSYEIVSVNGVNVEKKQEKEEYFNRNQVMDFINIQKTAFYKYLKSLALKKKYNNQNYHFLREDLFRFFCLNVFLIENHGCKKSTFEAYKVMEDRGDHTLYFEKKGIDIKAEFNEQLQNWRVL